MSITHDVMRAYTYKGRHRQETKHIRKTALAVTAAGAAVAAPLIGSGAAHADVWDQVAQCESSGDWSINTGNGYYGGLQFTNSTWAAFGGTAYASRADLATESQQKAIAAKTLAGQGAGAWTCAGAGGLTDTNGLSGYSASDSSSSGSSSSNLSSSSGSSSGSSSSDTSSSSSGSSYTVQSGDTLFKIAARVGASSWSAIYQLNTSSISNPDVIYPGQVLQLPN